MSLPDRQFLTFPIVEQQLGQKNSAVLQWN
jgi:hypothetical protein